MKKIFFYIPAILFFTSCGGINKQISQIRALEDCKYLVNSLDSISIANIKLQDFINGDNVNLANMPRLGLAILTKNVPLKAKINLTINNPTNKLAAINQFEYKVLVKNAEIASGLVNQRISISPKGGTTTVPLQINSNIYNFISDKSTLDAITGFFSESADRKKSGEYKQTLTIKIKPTLDLGNKQIKYPGFIDIDKEISTKDLFK